MDHDRLLIDLAIIVVTAAAASILFTRLRLPVVLGYLLAGLIVGPHTPPFPLVKDIHTVETLAELGVILLMFSLGLHFSLRKLASVGGTALVAAVMEIVTMIAVGYGIGRYFGWTTMDSIFLGAILSISSSTIIVKALEELKLTGKPFAGLVFGILIVEDLLGIAMLALLSSIALTGSLDPAEMGITLLRLGCFLAVVLVAGLLLVPRLLGFVARLRNNEIFLLTVLGLGFGLAMLAAAFEYSVALGAFLMGAVIAETRQGPQAAAVVEPVRDMFSAVFFVAIGMLIQPALLWEYAVPILVISAAVVLGKVLTCSLGAFVTGNNIRDSIKTGFAVSQIGEFSFIIAALGTSLSVTSDFLYPIAVSVSAITTLFTPFLIQGSDRSAEILLRLIPRSLQISIGLYERSPVHYADADRRRFAANLFKKWALQLGINLLLVAAVFLAARALAPRLEGRWELPQWTGGVRTLLWALAVLLVLPLLAATFKKLGAISLFVAELRLASRTDLTDRQAATSLLANLLLTANGTALFLLLLSLSYALLPPVPVLVALLVAFSVLAWLMQHHFAKAYARTQIALVGVFEGTAAAPEHQLEKVSTLLDAAQLRQVSISHVSAAAGRQIQELQIRAVTGASIVGIQREEESMVNPSPFEELTPGDAVLLIGTESQLEAAERLLATAPPA